MYMNSIPLPELVAGLFIGSVFGLLGAGGSIMIWPLLVLVLGHAEDVALMESLMIVGTIAVGGVIPYIFSRHVNYMAAALMGISGSLGASLGAYLGKDVAASTHRLVFIAIIWLAAWCMLLPSKKLNPSTEKNKLTLYFTCLIGALIGLVSGFSSIGGGFLIVPALVLFCHLPMHEAVGSSLGIITLNTFSGFITLLMTEPALFARVDDSTVVLYICVGLLGSSLGALYAQSVPQRRLRTLFGLMLLVISGFFGYDFIFPRG